MTTKKIMVIGITFVLASMLLSSGNALNLSFAQSNTLVQSNDGDGEQTSNANDNNNSDRQNYDDFQNCLEDDAGATGFATEQQIRDCFFPIYTDGNNNDDNTDAEEDNNNNSNNSNNNNN